MKRIIRLLIIMDLCAMTFVCTIIDFKNYDLLKGYILGKVKVVKEKIEKVIGTENNKTLTDEKLQTIEKSEKKDDEKRFRQEEKDKINKNIATKRRVKSMKKQKKTITSENVVEQFVWRDVRKKQSRFYGKASISIGYGYSKKNNYADQIIDYLRRPNLTNETSQSVSSEKNHFAFLSLGYNLYYRASDSFNPFIGFDIQGRIPLSSNGKQSVQYDMEVDVRSASTDLIEYYQTTKNTITYKEYGRFAAKLGAKINIWKNIGVEPYALYGINVANINQYLNQVYSKIEPVIGETIIRENGGKKSTNNIGVVYGAGMNFLLGYRFIVGIEYYRSVNTMINQDIYDFGHMTKGSKTHIKMDNIIFKLGYQFG